METNVSTNDKRTTFISTTTPCCTLKSFNKQSNTLRPIQCFQNTQAHDKLSVTLRQPNRYQLTTKYKCATRSRRRLSYLSHAHTREKWSRVQLHIVTLDASCSIHNHVDKLSPHRSCINSCILFTIFSLLINEVASAVNK
jgi:hypothetical protein